MLSTLAIISNQIELSLGVFDSFFITKAIQEWGRSLYSPWQSKIEAKLQEESKFWRSSKPFPNQSSMQGRESKKESNIHEIRKHLRNICKLVNCPRRNFASLVKPRRNFATPCEIFATLQNLFEIFRYFFTDSVRFLYQDILCNYLFSHCKL